MSGKPWLKLVPKPGEKLSAEVMLDIARSTKDEICVRCERPLGTGTPDCEVCEIVARSREAIVMVDEGE